VYLAAYFRLLDKKCLLYDLVVGNGQVKKVHLALRLSIDCVREINKELASDGWLRRDENGDDRSVKLVCPTDKLMLLLGAD
jgi:hypothetical protein